MSSLIIFLPAVDPAFDEAGNIIAGSVASLILFLLMLNVVLNLPVDILSSYAFFRMGCGLGFRSAWIAWIPGGALWVMGCIADQYQKLTKGRSSHLRWILLLHTVWSAFLLYVTTADGPMVEALLALCDRLLLIPLLLSIGGITAVYIALNRVYRFSGVQDSAVFTIFGVIFSIPTPFFLLHAAKDW